MKKKGGGGTKRSACHILRARPPPHETAHARLASVAQERRREFDAEISALRRQLEFEKRILLDEQARAAASQKSLLKKLHKVFICTVNAAIAFWRCRSFWVRPAPSVFFSSCRQRAAVQLLLFPSSVLGARQDCGFCLSFSLSVSSAVVQPLSRPCVLQASQRFASPPRLLGLPL